MTSFTALRPLHLPGFGELTPSFQKHSPSCLVFLQHHCLLFCQNTPFTPIERRGAFAVTGCTVVLRCLLPLLNIRLCQSSAASHKLSCGLQAYSSPPCRQPPHHLGFLYHSTPPNSSTLGITAARGRPSRFPKLFSQAKRMSAKGSGVVLGDALGVLGLPGLSYLGTCTASWLERCLPD